MLIVIVQSMFYNVFGILFISLLRYYSSATGVVAYAGCLKQRNLLL